MSEINEHSLNGLPKGWEWLQLGELIGSKGIFCDGDWIESKDQDKYGDIRLIQLADIGDGVFKNKSNRYLTTKRAKELNCTFLRRGDILVARMPDPLGRCCIFPLFENNKYITAVDVCIIRPNESKVDTKYLSYIINAPQSRAAINNLETGTTRKRISRKNLATIYFPLPPIAEQKFIVSKIEELISELDKSIEGLKTAQQQLKVYRQSVLKWAFEGRLTNEEVEENAIPEGWIQTTLNDISELITKGSSPKWQGINYVDDPKQILFVTSENVRENFIDITQPKYLEKKFNEKQKRSILRKGDILLNIVGASIGRAAIFNLDVLANINQAVSIIRLKESIRGKYVCFYLNSNNARSYYNLNKVDVARANLSLSDVANINIPLPSLKEQEAIIQEIESRLSVADKAEETIVNSLAQAEALRQSILKKAFEGKLI